MDIQGARALAHTVVSGLSKSPAADSADASQAARFRLLLQSSEPDGVAASPDAASAATGIAAPGAAAATGPDAAALAGLGTAPAAGAPTGPSSLGDTILRGIEKVRGSLNEGLAQTNALIDPETGPMSTGRLLQFQVGMLNMGFQYEMVAGVVTKTAQNIDQLVKMQ
jgi:type III secretion system YscI/HrpB-like protein